MAQEFVLYIDIENKQSRRVIASEVKVVPDTITWTNLLHMLRLRSGQEELGIYYIDEDYDRVVISNREEMREAFKVARRYNNVLHLLVICEEISSTTDTVNTQPIMHPQPHRATISRSVSLYPSLTEMQAMHLGVTCNNCGKVISGIRYKCWHCFDYDLCERCDSIQGLHNPSHIFLKIRQPLTYPLEPTLTRMFSSPPGGFDQACYPACVPPAPPCGLDQTYNPIHVPAAAFNVLGQAYNPLLIPAATQNSGNIPPSCLTNCTGPCYNAYSRCEEPVSTGLIAQRPVPACPTMITEPVVNSQMKPDEYVPNSSGPILIAGFSEPASTSSIIPVEPVLTARSYEPVPFVTAVCEPITTTSSVIKPIPMATALVNPISAANEVISPISTETTEAVFIAATLLEPAFSTTTVSEPVPTAMEPVSAAAVMVEPVFTSAMATEPVSAATIGTELVSTAAMVMGPASAAMVIEPVSAFARVSEPVSSASATVAEPVLSEAVANVESESLITDGEYLIVMQKDKKDVLLECSATGTDAENETKLSDLAKEMSHLNVIAEDVQSSDTTSDSDSDDFYIVPIPDCFNLNKPARKKASTTVLVLKRRFRKSPAVTTAVLCRRKTLRVGSVIKDAAAASNGETTVDAVNATVTVNTNEVSAIGNASEVAVAANVNFPAASVEEIKATDNVSKTIAISEEIAGNAENATASNIGELTAANATAVSNATAASVNEATVAANAAVAANSVEKVIAIANVKEMASAANATHEVTIAGKESSSAANIVQPAAGDSSGESTAIAIGEQTTDASAVFTKEVTTSTALSANSGEVIATDESSSTNKPEKPKRSGREGMVNLVHSAVGVAGRAATAAYYTAKDAYQNLHTRHNQQGSTWYPQSDGTWAPAESNWTPTQPQWNPAQPNWTPPQQQWTPPESNWTPAQQQWTPPQTDSPGLNAMIDIADAVYITSNSEGIEGAPNPMEQLIAMGFGNRELNARVLQAHNNDIEAALQELLLENDQWAAARH